jgi:hypothetical protein
VDSTIRNRLHLFLMKRRKSQGRASNSLLTKCLRVECQHVASDEGAPNPMKKFVFGEAIRHDPGALSPGREYPRFMYHATHTPTMVSSAREEADLGPEWSRVYIHQEYPKMKYHWNGKHTTVKTAQEDAALGAGWTDIPGAFEAYRGARRPRTPEQNPTTWVDEPKNGGRPRALSGEMVTIVQHEQ